MVDRDRTVNWLLDMSESPAAYRDRAEDAVRLIEGLEEQVVEALAAQHEAEAEVKSGEALLDMQREIVEEQRVEVERLRVALRYCHENTSDPNVAEVARAALDAVSAEKVNGWHTLAEAQPKPDTLCHVRTADGVEANARYDILRGDRQLWAVDSGPWLFTNPKDQWRVAVSAPGVSTGRMDAPPKEGT